MKYFTNKDKFIMFINKFRRKIYKFMTFIKTRKAHERKFSNTHKSRGE